MAQIPRIYTEQDLTQGAIIELESQASQHISRVLRLNIGDSVEVFNGRDGDWLTEIASASKKNTSLLIQQQIKPQQKLKLNTHLGQVVSKGDRMEYTIQKATELGVCEITPLWSERCEVKLKGERLEKKVDQWRKIAISACEQSGRNQLPIIHQPLNYLEWAEQQARDNSAQAKFILHPADNPELNAELSASEQYLSVALLIGPEGGFSQEEVNAAIAKQFNYLTLGPRVLRTETASVTALSIMQFLWGDF